MDARKKFLKDGGQTHKRQTIWRKMIPYMGKNTPIKKIISPIWRKIVMRKKDPPPPDREKGLGDFLKGRGGGRAPILAPPPAVTHAQS